MKIAFWTAVIAYEVIVIVKHVVLPALRRRDRRKLERMSATERKHYLKYINF